MSTKDLQTKVIELKDLKALAEELQAGIFKIRYKAVSSNRFDTKAFKTAYSNLYEQFTRHTTGYRFSVA